MTDKLHLVEGPFKNFTIRRVRPQDEDKVIQHIKDCFLHDEPTSKLLGYNEEYAEEFCSIGKHFFKDNLSFWMEDNDTGEVAAVRSTLIHKNDDPFWVAAAATFKTPEMLVMYQINESCLEAADISGRFGVDEYADFFVASCAPKYRNQGLSSELYRLSLILIKAVGLKVVKSTFTSPYTRAAVKKLGFQELSRVTYKGLKDSQGNLIFDQSKLTDEHFAALMVKVL